MKQKWEEEFDERFGAHALEVAFNSWEALDAVKAFISKVRAEAIEEERERVNKIIKQWGKGYGYDQKETCEILLHEINKKPAIYKAAIVRALKEKG